MPYTNEFTPRPPIEQPDAEAVEDIRDRIPERCTCETCKFRRFEGNKLSHALVRRYSYRPRAWKMYAVKNDKHDYYLGVELETDNYSGGNRWSRGARAIVSNQIAASMRRPKMFWLPKHDGSVSGPEFVSMPATLSYWRSKEKYLAEMFQMLVHAGYRSHQNGNCGMHINISRNAFADTGHLFRFLSIIHRAPSWTLKMAQRTRAQAEQWASLEWMDNVADIQNMCEQMMPHTDSWGYTRPGHTSSRYVAVNAPSGEQRFEFRLPRGTLRLDRFYKNLEWTVAMIEYTRTCTTRNANATKFMTWVEANKAEYPYLAKYIAEKIGVAV